MVKGSGLDCIPILNQDCELIQELIAAFQYLRSTYFDGESNSFLVIFEP